jgi:hypothetical protein
MCPVAVRECLAFVVENAFGTLNDICAIHEYDIGYAHKVQDEQQ